MEEDLSPTAAIRQAPSSLVSFITHLSRFQDKPQSLIWPNNPIAGMDLAKFIEIRLELYNGKSNLNVGFLNCLVNAVLTRSEIFKGRGMGKKKKKSNENKERKFAFLNNSNIITS